MGAGDEPGPPPRATTVGESGAEEGAEDAAARSRSRSRSRALEPTRDVGGVPGLPPPLASAPGRGLGARGAGTAASGGGGAARGALGGGDAGAGDGIAGTPRRGDGMGIARARAMF